MSNLTEEQRAIVDSSAPRILVEAGPGTGKTTTIAHRLARLITSGDVLPSEIAVFTYTRAMARDLVKRVRGIVPSMVACRPCDGTGSVGDSMCSACMGAGYYVVSDLNIGTLHAMAARIINDSLAAAPGDARAMARDAIIAFGWLPTDARSFTFATPDDIEDLLKIAKEKVPRKTTIKSLREGLSLAGAALGTGPETALRSELSARGMLTYDDALTVCAAQLETMAQRGSPIGARWPVLMVDERQDLTDAHWRIVDAWGARSLLVVGDSAQAIFGFLGAANREFAGAEPERFSLTTNFRSGVEIVSRTNRVRERRAADLLCRPLVQVSGADDPTSVVWERRCDRQAEDARDVVLSLLATFPPETIAVLAPVWSDLAEARDALEAAGVVCNYPEAAVNKLWSTVAGRTFIAACRAVQSLSYGAGSYDEHGLALLLRGLGVTGAESEIKGAALSGRVSLAAATSSYLRRRDLRSELAEIEGHMDIGDVLTAFRLSMPGESKAVVSEVQRWLASAPDGAGVAELLADRAGVTAPDASDDPPGVRLRTIHGAKGQEWDAVVLLSASEGGIPTQWQKTPELEAEGARMLYVGTTRAKRLLAVLSPTVIRGKERQPTRWLRD